MQFMSGFYYKIGSLSKKIWTVLKVHLKIEMVCSVWGAFEFCDETWTSWSTTLTKWHSIHLVKTRSCIHFHDRNLNLNHSTTYWKRSYLASSCLWVLNSNIELVKSHIGNEYRPLALIQKFRRRRRRTTSKQIRWLYNHCFKMKDSI